MPGKKVPEWHSGLRPSEKALPEQRSITKIPLCIVIFFTKEGFSPQPLQVQSGIILSNKLQLLLPQCFTDHHRQTSDHLIQCYF
jgi:hypothetical protein